MPYQPVGGIRARGYVADETSLWLSHPAGAHGPRLLSTLQTQERSSCFNSRFLTLSRDGGAEKIKYVLKVIDETRNLKKWQNPNCTKAATSTEKPS